MRKDKHKTHPRVWVKSTKEHSVSALISCEPGMMHLFLLFVFLIRFNISTPAFRGCMKNLKKTSGVVRLNDTVGVTKKCSEDWKVSEGSELREGVLLSQPAFCIH